jgi:hypothetical protein
MKLVQFFIKYNLSIITLFESYLFKNNKHNYKSPNTMKIKKLDLNNQVVVPQHY